ncbi:MAG: ROK family protein [Armatimonadota bacterium]
MNERLIGYDIGGTKCAVILGKLTNGEIEILDRVGFPTESEHGPEQALCRLEESTNVLLARHGLQLDRIKAIGISCGGPLDSRRGIIMSPPNLPGWDEIHITDRFEKAFGLPVRLQNDANACALAEWKWGAGRHTGNMIFMTFGTGLGAGLILDGKLYSGTNDMAGEVGHIRLAENGPEGYGKRGSFEGFCSGGGIGRLAREVISRYWAEGRSVSFCSNPDELEHVNAQTTAEAANAGDPAALEIYNTVGLYLGRGLSMLIDILNPEVIVIGSVFTRQHALLWPVASKIIEKEALADAARVCRVLPAQLGEAIGDYASLSVADSE